MRLLTIDLSRIDTTRWWLPLALTALAYLGTGAVTLLLVLPAGYASPLFPAAGVALASVLIYGRNALVGVAVSAFVLTSALLAWRGHLDAPALLAALAFAAGATLQAFVGARLVRRYVSQPLTLTLPADVARFYAACAGSSAVSATVAALAFRLAGLVPTPALLLCWATWWVGDLTGLLIATPIMLTLIGRPASEWVPRRVSVGVTLALVMVFSAQASSRSAAGTRSACAHRSTTMRRTPR